jgi:DNA ligase-1
MIPENKKNLSLITKPIKAATYIAGETKIQFPCQVTDKFDGIRCIKTGGRALTSAFKPIPNDFIRGWIEANCPDGFDGEIMVIGREFNDLSGDVRRKDGKPDFRYHVFDWVTHLGLSVPYSERCATLEDWSKRRQAGQGKADRVVLELPVTAKNEAELAAIEEAALTERHREGVMIRSANSPYKCGRSTINEGYLIKIKRFQDDEAMCIGTKEEMENTNPATQDNFGRAERSTHKAGMVPKGRLGKLLCRTKAGVEFEIGTGFTATDRAWLWEHRATLPGKQVKFKFQPHGMKEKPRCPVFLAFRDSWDI